MAETPTRVVRGGSFNNNPNELRCAYRNNNHPENRNNNLGFRVVWLSSGAPEMCAANFQELRTRQSSRAFPQESHGKRAISCPAERPGREQISRAKKKALHSAGSASDGEMRGRSFETKRGKLEMDDTSLPAIQKAYDINRWLLPMVARYPKTHKFTLGDRVQVAALDLQLALVEAAHARTKERTLHRASAARNRLSATVARCCASTIRRKITFTN